MIVYIMAKEKRTDKLLVTTSQCAWGVMILLITVARIVYHSSLSFVNWQNIRIIHVSIFNRERRLITIEYYTQRS